MAEVIFPGPAGRIEGRYHPGKTENAPIALVLHPHPKAGGSMQDRIAIQMFKMYVERGFAVLRFNFRGVGKSQGVFDNGQGELSDAASALDWLQSMNPNAQQSWVAGYSFGAYVAMQLLMRRPEINGFIAVAPPANHYDFSFLAPCPSSGIILSGTRDTVTPWVDVERVASKIRTQKGIVVDYDSIEGANHFFLNELPELNVKACAYLDRRLAEGVRPMISTSRRGGSHA
jgi:uncharacterized protein